jgi:hypothetical protein
LGRAGKVGAGWAAPDWAAGKEMGHRGDDARTLGGLGRVERGRERASGMRARLGSEVVSAEP